MMSDHRKRVRHYREPGDCHELTFSCYRRLPLLTDDSWRRMFCMLVDRALSTRAFRLVAFVLMPEHVHLLVYPTKSDPDIHKLLAAIKRPYSFRVKQQLVDGNRQLLGQLTIRERPGKQTFRYWQEGPGYDRNFSSERATMNAIDYIHHNPVRRGLAQRAGDWKWSSARWYESDRQIVVPDLPTIHGLPWEFFVES